MSSEVKEFSVPFGMLASSGIWKEEVVLLVLAVGLKLLEAAGCGWFKPVDWKWWKSNNWNTAHMQPADVEDVVMSPSTIPLLFEDFPPQYHSLPISSICVCVCVWVYISISLYFFSNFQHTDKIKLIYICIKEMKGPFGEWVEFKMR